MLTEIFTLCTATFSTLLQIDPCNGSVHKNWIWTCMRKIESLVIWEICAFLSSVQWIRYNERISIDCFFFNDVRLCNEDFVCLQHLEKFCDFQFFFHEINQGMSDVFMSVIRTLENIFIIMNVTWIKQCQWNWVQTIVHNSCIISH